MSSQPWSSRLALWLAVCALLLKAAVPMLASASAQAQGKTLVEVCTVYGVATVALDDSGQGAPDHAAPHAGGDHCALNALMALATPEPAVLATSVPPQPARPLVPARATAVPRDASAAWAAGLKHGPPAFA